MATAQTTPKKYKAREFKIATEGPTADGRNINRQDILDAAATYDPKKYGARIWLEHLRSYSSNSEFSAYGDITAARSAIEDGKAVLYATIEPLDNLVAINSRRQKIYSSAELQQNFGQTGKTYLVGMAVTDSPASMGTEALQFSARRLVADHPTHLFTTPFEVDMAAGFEVDSPPGSSIGDRILASLDRMTALFSTGGIAPQQPQQQPQQQQQPAPAKIDLSEIKQLFTDLNAAYETRLTALQAQVTQLSTKIDTTDHSSQHRPPATGGGGADPAGY